MSPQNWLDIKNKNILNICEENFIKHIEYDKDTIDNSKSKKITFIIYGYNILIRPAIFSLHCLIQMNNKFESTYTKIFEKILYIIKKDFENTKLSIKFFTTDLKKHL